MLAPEPTKYPDLTISDDWNAGAPKPVTSFADDVKKASAEPKPVVQDTAPLVETSAGAVQPDTATAEAAKDVARKEDGDTGGTKPGDSGATEPAVTKSVSRTSNKDS